MSAGMRTGAWTLLGASLQPDGTIRVSFQSPPTDGSAYAEVVDLVLDAQDIRDLKEVLEVLETLDSKSTKG